MLNYIHWKIPFTIHTDASDKQLGAGTRKKIKLHFYSKTFRSTIELYENREGTSLGS